MTIIVPKRILGEMLLHALEEDPKECCGLLIGAQGNPSKVEVLRRVKNVHEKPIRRYAMDSLDWQKIQTYVDTIGKSIVAIYHSHTFTQAYPSETDVQNALGTWFTAPAYSHILISLVEKTRPVIRAFTISDDGDVEEIFITTDGEAYQELDSSG